MKNPSKKILIVGLFLAEKNRTLIMRTAADQLAELLQHNNIQTITVSDQLGKIGRFTDTVGTIFRRRKEYEIAIVPLYGGMMSYIWEAVSTSLLKVLGKKVILIIHGGSIPARMKQSPAKYLRSFKRADVIVCPSAFIQTVLNDYGVKSILIENVVQLKEYSFQHKTTFGPRLFWMRTLEDIYNPQMAVRVAGILAKKYPGFHMVMAGYDRGLLHELKELAAELQVLDKIEFPGYINQQQKAQYAKTHDIYVCTNLIDNALKYGANGTPASIEVSAGLASGHAEISVADHGPGIAEADRERALKRFVRLEASRSQPGSGLGLSLVAAVARLHGGSLRLEDHHPGLRVVIALPLAIPQDTGTAHAGRNLEDARA